MKYFGYLVLGFIVFGIVEFLSANVEGGGISVLCAIVVICTVIIVDTIKNNNHEKQIVNSLSSDIRRHKQ
ncbi:hypothetical protein [Clostridium sp. CF012]|uniref:hypothetical protein n=1 Tax=Clostridium sp. CF012 TaxID=2843319 RepID=UPI001C0B20F3|nr:hypothetical protein [Clostridium sp. CF012]MBU3145196.1 hypothetical protein [Clostridium sp. CF012]